MSTPASTHEVATKVQSLSELSDNRSRILESEISRSKGVSEVDQYRCQELKTVTVFHRTRLAQRTAVVRCVGVPDRRRANFYASGVYNRRLKPAHRLQNSFGGRVCRCEIANRGISGVEAGPHRGGAGDFAGDRIGFHHD